MKLKCNRILASVSVGALVGCSQFSSVMAPAEPGGIATAQGRGPDTRKPLASRVSAGVITDVADLYRRGRQAQDAGDHAQAAALYGKVLAVAPAHSDALNALGVIRAGEGRLAEALVLFERAAAAAPRAAHVRNNRGYALLLAGRLDEAETELQAAMSLSPTSARTRINLDQLSKARADATARALGAEPAAQVQLVAVAPNIYELRDPARRPASQAAGAAGAGKPVAEVSTGVDSRVPAAELAGVRLEVSNGVGIRHMAWRTARRLTSLGVVTTRLTNQPGYRQMKTEIQFSKGQQGAAEALSARLPTTPRIVAAHLAPNVQVRLVLGHDQVGKSIAAWIDEGPATQVSANTTSGWLLG